MTDKHPQPYRIMTRSLVIEQPINALIIVGMMANAGRSFYEAYISAMRDTGSTGLILTQVEAVYENCDIQFALTFTPPMQFGDTNDRQAPTAKARQTDGAPVCADQRCHNRA